MPEALIVDGVRTPIGSHGGSLAEVRPDDMAAHVIGRLLEPQPGVHRERLGDVVLGCTNQSGEDNRNVARTAGLLAGPPASVPGAGRGATERFERDEFLRPETTIEGLAKLRPAFRQGGSVTAGNASGINDGACARLVASEAAVKEFGLTPLARVVTSAAADVEPRIMGMGPVPATRAALAQAGLALDDVSVIELNEAFAAQALACLRELGLPDDGARVNPDGGAIALGHPLGMSGARLLLTAARELERTGERYALATMCVGVGQGMATVVERV